MNPKISLVVPMYGVESYIERCLQSIYANPEAKDCIELILIDDGSPDKSSQIAQRWITSNSITNARIISQENRGLGGARNTGLRNAKSPWIWFIDSDDEILPDALNNILKRLDTSLDFIAFNYLLLPEIQLGFNVSEPIECVPVEVVARNFIINSPCFNVYKTNFLRSNELWFREKFLHEDNEMAIRVLSYAKDISFYPIVIYKYYLSNASSITNTPVTQKKINDLLEHFKTYTSLCREITNRKKKIAIQQINQIPIYWLFKYEEISKGILKNYINKSIIQKRREILRSISLLSWKYRLGVWLKIKLLYLKK
ncbi:MAG: glycosyltransferase [Paramuribaculum sp.]